jgi:glycosyltransferase involved in cell wall biosynthesis
MQTLVAAKMARPGHVLLTANAAWNIWNFRRPLVEALLADDCQVTVLAPEDEAAHRLSELGCRFRPLVMNVKGLNPLDDVLLATRMRRVFAAERPDAILSYTIKNNVFGALAAKSLKIPFIPNVTGLGTAFLSGRALQALVEQLYRTAFRSLPTVFFQNDDDRALFLERKLIQPAQAALLPGSGIDLVQFAPAAFPQDGPPVFLMIARLLRDKGVVEYVEAARRVRAQVPEARFQLLGAAGAANRTAIDLDTVRGWEQSHGIEYLGTCADVRPHIAVAQCVVLPSYREGAPRTLIEAAAMARPVIATDVPGCRAVVDAGQSGFLCQPRDADSLAEAMLRFLALSPGERRAMGARGRAKMEREYCHSIIVNAYHRALAGTARAA